MIKFIQALLNPPEDSAPSQSTATSPRHSAREWMDHDPVTIKFLELVEAMSNKYSIELSLPFRIAMAWESKEEHKEDLVYIEALMPSKNDLLSGVHLIEDKSTERPPYKLASFLVCLEDYKKLLLLQKDHFGLL
jgi:hypothetical protein